MDTNIFIIVIFIDIVLGVNNYPIYFSFFSLFTMKQSVVSKLIKKKNSIGVTVLVYQQLLKATVSISNMKKCYKAIPILHWTFLK